MAVKCVTFHSFLLFILKFITSHIYSPFEKLISRIENKMLNVLVFFCILRMVVVGIASPTPQKNCTIEKITSAKDQEHYYWRTVPPSMPAVSLLNAESLPSSEILFRKSFPVPIYNVRLNQYPVPILHSLTYNEDKLWHNLRGSRRVVTCHADDGHSFDGFPCEDGVCLPLHWICDGETDCKNGADEADCDECAPDELSCTVRGVRKCLAPRFLCDGRKDCQNGLDEDPANCHTSCEFACRDGRGCIPHRLVCDSDHDCLDGSDEFSCSHPPLHEECYPEFEFQCYDSLNEEEWTHCIPRAWLCDNHDDCPNGEDESLTVCDRIHTYD